MCGIKTVAAALFAAAACGQERFGEPAKVEVAGYAIEAKAQLHVGKQIVNGKEQPFGSASLSFEVAPKTPAEGKKLFGLDATLKCSEAPNAAGRPRPAFPGQPGNQANMMNDDHARTHNLQFAAMRAGGGRMTELPANGPRYFQHQTQLLAKDGEFPKELTAVEGELLVADLEDEEYVFAGADFAAGTDLTQKGVKVRLYCCDVDEQTVALGVRFRGSAEKLNGIVSTNGGGFAGGRQSIRWILETADGAKIPGGSSGISGISGTGGNRNGEMVYRMTSEFHLPAGKKPKSLTITVTKIAGEWQRHPFKIEKLPLPKPPAGQ